MKVLFALALTIIGLLAFRGHSRELDLNLQVSAQTTTHSVTFQILGPGPVTLYKAVAPGPCSGVSSFANLATITPTGYTDTGLAAGEVRCYYGMLPGNIPTTPLEVTVPVSGSVVTKDWSTDVTGVVQ